MKPGNLRKRGAKSGGETKDEDSINTHIECLDVCFLFFMANYWIIFPSDSGSFALQLRLKNLAIHKVFLRLFTLPQAKISR